MTELGAAIAENPFAVLELDASATRAEVERAGQKWLAMLELGLASARLYATLLGPRARTPEAVRAAMAQLREPDKRALAELWWSPDAGVAAAEVADDAAMSADDDLAALGFDAMTPLGWSGR